MNAQISRTPHERLTEVAEWLESRTPPKAGVTEFHMHHWVEKNDCGTSCCIGGSIVQFDQAAQQKNSLVEGEVCEISQELTDIYCDIGDYAGDLCGLNPVEATMLFRENMRATPAEAAETIRRYIDTGKLYWSDGDGIGQESDEVIRSRALPTMNSVLLGVDGKPLAAADTHVTAVLNTVTGLVRAWKPFGNKRFRHHAAIDAACALPKLPGHTPWELSSKADLKAILASDAAAGFDAEQYPDILKEWYWAKDIYEREGASSPADLAWSVLFVSGFISWGGRCGLGRALAVCRPLPASQQ